MADLELKKAFAEHQSKMQELVQRVKLSEGQIAALQREIQLVKLTDKEIGALPADTSVYKSSGRMFILQTIPEARRRLDKKQQGAQDKIKKIKDNVAYWERAVKESEAGVRELVSQKRDK